MIRFIILSLFLGSVLGVGMAFTLHYLDNTINSASELSHLVHLPMLAVIPRHGIPATGAGARAAQNAATEPAIC